jgi:hypothetical protein
LCLETFHAGRCCDDRVAEFLCQSAAAAKKRREIPLPEVPLNSASKV